MIGRAGLLRYVVLMMAGTLLGAPMARAQEAAPVPGGQRALATRAELEATAAALEGSSAAGAADEARLIRSRLATGDFAVGDRLLLRVQDEAALTDTFSVRSNQVIELPNIPPISLKGVLRSEAEAHIRGQVARYIRDPIVRVEPLIRIAISGSVTRPGFYALPANLQVSDALMAAGGPTGTGDLKKVSILRAGVEIATKERMQQAFARGATLDLLSLQTGDEIVIRDRSRGASGVLQTAGLISGVLFGVAAVVTIF